MLINLLIYVLVLPKHIIAMQDFPPSPMAFLACTQVQVYKSISTTSE